MKHIVILTGAGISAESGLKTFRDANGLWEGHNVIDIASPKGFLKNPELVLNFYNERRKQLMSVHPNSAHYALSELQIDNKVTIITQNVDDLHERAGSKNIIHLHGELLKVRSVNDELAVQEWKNDLILGDLCLKGHQLRPHIVWFGESVSLMPKAIEICKSADVLLIVGTSMQVYPAASLINYVKPKINIYYIDPSPAMTSNSQITVITEKATKGVPLAIRRIYERV